MDRRKVLLVAAVLMAVVGAGLVLLYVQDAEDRAADQLDTVPVLVAQQRIFTGESFTSIAGKVVVQQVPSSELLDGATSDIDDFADQYARMPLFPGEQLVADKFAEASTLPLPPDTQGVMLDLSDTERLAAFTQPGSRVSVYALPTEVDVDATEAPFQLEDVLIASVGSRTLIPGGLTDIDGQPLPEIPDNLVVVAVDSADAQKLLNYAGSDDYTIQFSVPASDAPTGDGTE